MYEPETRPSTGSRLIFPFVGILIVIAIVLFAVFVLDVGGSGDDTAQGPTPEPSPTQPTASPAEQALTQYVQTTMGATYVGDCSRATPEGQAPGQPLRLCSSGQGQRENMEAYTLGVPAAEPTHWAFLTQQGGAWQVAAVKEITADTRAVPGIPWPLRSGAEVVVIGTGQCLNVRTEPRFDPGNAVDCIADGATIRLSTGPIDADQTQWWQVEGRAGWVAATYLRYPDAVR
jgi:hypothetical protein